MNHYIIEIFTDEPERFQEIRNVRNQIIVGLITKQKKYDLESSLSHQKYSTKMKK